MKSFFRRIVLSNIILREFFFILFQKNINRGRIDRKISSLTSKVDTRSPILGLIVSLTSYGDRLNELHYTLYSLISQTIKPEKIIVYLSDEDYRRLPKYLYIFQNFGIEFVTTENLRSYTKLIPALLSYPDKVIVTADDDIYYNKKWLSKLWYEHNLYPNQIICHIVYLIKTQQDRIAKYDFWDHKAQKQNADRKNFLMGVGGVLYPSNSLYKDICNKDLFLKLSPAADDIWFYFMALLKGTLIRQLQKPYTHLRYVNPHREYGISHGQTLGQINVGEGQNDIQFNSILNFYEIKELKLISYYLNECDSLRD